MAGAPEPALEEQLWTIAVARLLFGPSMSIQAPPNLRPEGLDSLVRAGINDWGGVSPVTPDHVNPEAPWPHLAGSCARDRRGRAGSDRASGPGARLCSAARGVDGSGHHAARAPLQRQPRLCAAGPLVRGLGLRIAADRSALVIGRPRARYGLRTRVADHAPSCGRAAGQRGCQRGQRAQRESTRSSLRHAQGTR